MQNDSCLGWKVHSPLRVMVLALVVCYGVCVVILPTWVYPNLPLDTLEAVAWGKQWQWGYDKHPFLSAVFASVAAFLSHPSAWALYALSAACVLVALGYVALYVHQVTGDARQVLLAVLLSWVLYCFEITILEFNVNVLLMPLWAGFVYHIYRAMQHQGMRDWVCVGLCLGLGFVTKYTMVLYALPALGFLVFQKACRKSWFRPGIYVAGCLALLCVVPHLWWLFQNDWVCVQYALHRGVQNQYVFLQSIPLLAHVFYPAKLLIDFFAAIAFSLILFWWVQRKSGFVLRAHASWHQSWHRLLWVGPLLPFLLLALCGSNVRGAYLLPLMPWMGAYWVLTYRVTPSLCVLKRCVGVVMCVMVCVSVGYAAVGYVRAEHRMVGHLPRAFFPGRTLAQEAESFWMHHAKGLPLQYVVGDPWLVSNVGFYAPSYPQSLLSPMAVTRETYALRREGVLLVLNESDGLSEWEARLKPLQVQASRALVLHRGARQIKVRVAVLQ